MYHKYIKQWLLWAICHLLTYLNFLCEPRGTNNLVNFFITINEFIWKTGLLPRVCVCVIRCLGELWRFAGEKLSNMVFNNIIVVIIIIISPFSIYIYDELTIEINVEGGHINPLLLLLSIIFFAPFFTRTCVLIMDVDVHVHLYHVFVWVLTVETITLNHKGENATRYKMDLCSCVRVSLCERIPKRTSRTNHVLSGLVIYDPSNK